MPVFNFQLPWKDGTIFQLGDGHDGTKAQSIVKIKEAVYIIKEERKSLWVYTGDAAETIMVDDPRYEADQHTMPTADRQIDSVVTTYSPIKKQLLALLMGNHELKLKKHVNMTYGICKGLGKPEAYGGWTSIINFYDKAGIQQWTGFWTHGPMSRRGFGSTAGDAGQRQANTEAALKKTLAPLHNAHYMGCGHFHRLILRQPIKELYLTTKGDRKVHQQYTGGLIAHGYIHPDLRWYGCNGGFLKQYLMSDEYSNLTLDNIEPMTYSEIAGYHPVEMGMIKLNIRNYKLESCEKIIL